jgi:hypothetical protein
MEEVGWVRASESRQGTAAICSAHTNATGIAISLRELGWKGRIICLNFNGESSLVRRWPGLCECWDISLGQLGDFYEALASRLTLEEVSCVFFTTERFLRTFNDHGAERLPSARFKVGTSTHLEEILDRRRFYRFISDRGLADVPYTVGSLEDPVATFGPDYHIRVWRSWCGMKKLPRRMSIHSRQNLDDWLSLCDQRGLRHEDWGYQELLSLKPEHNVSVSGWHDPQFRFYVVSRKVFVQNQLGWLVELVDVFSELKERTRDILNALNFSGPFEMEFLLDPRTGGYKVNELNPGFGCNTALRHPRAGTPSCGATLACHMDPVSTSPLLRSVSG